MNIKLIFNADDYGRTPEVSRGIREAHLRGLVTSTTCMMNLPDTANDIRLARDLAPRLGLGVHLTLTADSPLLPPRTIPTICDSSGKFLKLDRLIAALETVNVDEVKAEWRAQIEAFIKAAKRNPTHIDSHHHSSYFTPQFFRALLELAREYDCAIRLPVVDKVNLTVTGLPEEVTAGIQKEIAALMHEFNPRTPDGFCADFYDDLATEGELRDYISTRSDGVYEIMCHPGHNDAALESVSSYNRARESEWTVLTSPRVLSFIKESGLTLVHFGGLPGV
jgi:predicted glycoside hydrolase/deacetylase ChbG (UPF0249 family)